MSIEITHQEKPTTQDKIDDEDYMLPHHIEGVLPDYTGLSGKTIQVPLLIEEKTVSDVSEVVFSNLNGDVDEGYILVSDLILSPGTPEQQIYLKFNGDGTANNYTNNILNFATTYGTSVNWSSPYCIMTRSYKSGSTVKSYSKTDIRTKTGHYRFYYSRFNLSSPVNGWCSVRWNNLVDNITSLVISSSIRTFSGVLRLYKIIHIELE